MFFLPSLIYHKKYECYEEFITSLLFFSINNNLTKWDILIKERELINCPICYVTQGAQTSKVLETFEVFLGVFA